MDGMSSAERSSRQRFCSYRACDALRRQHSRGTMRRYSGRPLVPAGSIGAVARQPEIAQLQSSVGRDSHCRTRPMKPFSIA
jgi:hypothetical protein